MSQPLIIFDLNRTLYDPESDSLMPRALEVLKTCTERRYVLALVSRNEPTRGSIIDRFHLRPWFRSIHLVEEKTIALFSELLQEMGSDPQKSFAIGDVVSKEIALGNACGMQTIWLRAGKFKDVVPTSSSEEPTRIVHDLGECLVHIPVADVT